MGRLAVDLGLDATIFLEYNFYIQKSQLPLNFLFFGKLNVAVLAVEEGEELFDDIFVEDCKSIVHVAEPNCGSQKNGA